MAKFHSILKVQVAEIFKRKTPNESAMITLHCKVYSNTTNTKHVDEYAYILLSVLLLQNQSRGVASFFSEYLE